MLVCLLLSLFSELAFKYIHSKLKRFCFPVCRVKGVMADQEESLLQQLTEITQMMQEGQLVEGMAPEKKPQDEWKGKRLYFTHRKMFSYQIFRKEKK